VITHFVTKQRRVCSKQRAAAALYDVCSTPCIYKGGIEQRMNVISSETHTNIKLSATSSFILYMLVYKLRLFVAHVCV
jgi:hypothetical protein